MNFSICRVPRSKPLHPLRDGYSVFVMEFWASPTGEWDGGEGTGQGVRQPAWAAREEEDVMGVGRKERNFKIQITENTQKAKYPYHPEDLIYTLTYMPSEQFKC